jgi:hypothetical protein
VTRLDYAHVVALTVTFTALVFCALSLMWVAP